MNIPIQYIFQNTFERNGKNYLQSICIALAKIYDTRTICYCSIGFTRQRPPNPDMGSSQYSFTEQNDQVILWGFGMIFATKNDGLFLGRHEFEPKFLKVNSLLPNIWDPDQFPPRTIPKTQEETLLMLQLLVKSIKWLENYESWVLAKCGQLYRNESLYGKNSHGEHHICLDKKWHELSEKFAKILKTSKPESNHKC